MTYATKEQAEAAAAAINAQRKKTRGHIESFAIPTLKGWVVTSVPLY